MPPPWARLCSSFLYYRLRPWDNEALGQRWGHLVLTFHLAASVVPYLGFTASHGFWQYNRVLFFRFLLATLYSLVLFVGLVLALVAVDNLLGVEVPDLHYPRLFFLIAFFFHPVHFLAGVPADFEELERSRYYPGALRVLCQFVMLPLVAVYVTILMLYLGRIVVTGTWPSGWTGYLVSCLAVAGIFSLLVAYPERIGGKKAWIDWYALAFWIAIVPASVMALLALWQRIEQYGMTERRYLLGVLAVWLGAMALHRVLTRSRDIKAIPMTLTIIGVVTFVGPWSAYAAAERSQAARVEEILAAHRGLVEGAGGGRGGRDSVRRMGTGRGGGGLPDRQSRHRGGGGVDGGCRARAHGRGRRAARPGRADRAGRGGAARASGAAGATGGDRGRGPGGRRCRSTGSISRSWPTKRGRPGWGTRICASSSRKTAPKW